MAWLKIGVLVLLILYVLIGAILYLFQERMIFRPDPLDSDFVYEFEATFEEVDFKMKDGASINGLHFKASNAKGIILYFHGNAGNLERWGEVVLPFTEFGYEVLVIDYRGYGKSTGKRTKKRMLTDAEALYEHVRKQWPENKIVIYGRSLGSSFASHVAGKNHPSKLILESPFYSLTDIARRGFWMYPTDAIVKFNFKNQLSLRNVLCPVVIVHGIDDDIVPLASGEKLYRRLKEKGKTAQIYPIDGAGHNDLNQFDEYWEVISGTLE